MIWAAAACALTVAWPADRTDRLESVCGAGTAMETVVHGAPLDPPKTSPKNRWSFDRLVDGLARLPGGGESFLPRVRVFSQTGPDDKRAEQVARMAMRLWDFDYSVLRLDHAEQYNDRIVDFYLCTGGSPGGEQLFGEDRDGGRAEKVNTIYIYDMAGFTDPVEMAREVAHEYGHATLPPVGGYKAPEYWANGFLGEKIFVRWMRDEMAAGRLGPDDAMGVDLKSLDAWVKVNVDAATQRTATLGPRPEVLARHDAAAMNAYMGLVLLVDATMPPRVMARSLKLIGSTKGADYPASAVAAVEEAEPFTVRVPTGLEGKPLWLPLGKSKVAGAKVLKRRIGWAQVVPAGRAIVVTPPVG